LKKSISWCHNNQTLQWCKKTLQWNFQNLIYNAGFNQGQATMVTCPWIFLKTHVIKKSSTLQRQMQILKCNVRPLNLKVVNVETKYKKVTFAIQPLCVMGGSNLWEIRMLGIKQCELWNVWNSVNKKLQIQYVHNQSSLIIDSFKWRWHL
jgi:hypothetical protein